jgi:hypothetical protein
MKLLLAGLATLLVYQACDVPKREQSPELKSFFNECDEVNIVYFSKDTFVYETKDTFIINHFTELILGENDNKLPDPYKNPDVRLIYKKKTNAFFTANVFYHDNKEGVTSNYVTYVLQNKKYKHLLTYPTDMIIGDINSENINSPDTSQSNIDTTK